MKLRSFLCCFSSNTGLDESSSVLAQEPGALLQERPGASPQESRVHTIYERKNSSVEIKARNALQTRNGKMEGADAQGTPQLAAMQSFGQRLFVQLCEREDFKSCLKNVRETPGDENAREELHTLCERYAYGFHARIIGREPVLLSEKKQEELLNGLQKIENDKVYLVGQSFKDILTGVFNPAQALKHDRAEALTSPFYVHYRAFDKDYRPFSDPETASWQDLL